MSFRLNQKIGRPAYIADRPLEIEKEDYESHPALDVYQLFYHNHLQCQIFVQPDHKKYLEKAYSNLSPVFHTSFSVFQIIGVNIFRNARLPLRPT